MELTSKSPTETTRLEQTSRTTQFTSAVSEMSETTIPVTDKSSTSRVAKPQITTEAISTERTEPSTETSGMTITSGKTIIFHSTEASTGTTTMIDNYKNGNIDGTWSRNK